MPWKRRRTRRLILTLAAALVVLAGLLVAAGGLLGWFEQPAAIVNFASPGSATGDAADYLAEAETASALADRMMLLMKDDSTGLLVASYRLSGKYDKPPAEKSADILASDQLLYGSWLVEQDRRDDFRNWWMAFAKIFLTQENLIRSYAGLPDESVTQSADFWRVNLSAMRVLAQGCTRWPDEGRENVLRSLSDSLADLAASGIGSDYAASVPTAAPTLDPAATPTPKPSLTPTPGPGKTLDILRLATVDLFTIREMAALDSRWQRIYAGLLTTVENGYISDSLPLYALGYSSEQQGYLYFNGTIPAINTEEALLSILHLCEVGKENSRSLNWLRDQMYNQHAIYESYHIAQGQAISSDECVSGYAIVARIARIIDDRDLYDAAIARLLWHQATSTTSAGRSAIFREGEDDLIYIYTRDNILALLALR